MNISEAIQPRVIRERRGKSPGRSQKVRSLTLRELIKLDRPVTVEELNAALPFLSQPSIRAALGRGEIPGVKITKNRWAINRAWLIKLSDQQKLGK